MRLLLAILATAFGSLLLPTVWDRFMSAAPGWLWQIVQCLFVLTGLSLALSYDQIWTILSAPRQHPLGSTLIFTVAAAILAGSAWWIFIAGKPDGRLEFFAIVSLADQPAGTVISGITWRRPYARVQVKIANPTTLDYENLDLLINTDHLIAGIGRSSVQSDVTFEVKDGRWLAMELHRQDGTRVAIPLVVLGNGVGYHVRCPKLPARQAIELTLATVSGLGKVDEPIKNHNDPAYRIRLNVGDKSLWYGKDARPDSVYDAKAAPTTLLIDGNYSVRQFDFNLSKKVPISDILGDAARKVRSGK